MRLSKGMKGLTSLVAAGGLALTTACATGGRVNYPSGPYPENRPDPTQQHKKRGAWYWDFSSFAVTTLATATIAANWGFTNDAAGRDPPENLKIPLLRPNPTGEEVNQYYIWALGANTLLSLALPHDLRNLFEAGVVIYGTMGVGRGLNLGLKLKF